MLVSLKAGRFFSALLLYRFEWIERLDLILHGKPPFMISLHPASHNVSLLRGEIVHKSRVTTLAITDYETVTYSVKRGPRML